MVQEQQHCTECQCGSGWSVAGRLNWPHLAQLESGGVGMQAWQVHWLISAPQVKSATSKHTRQSASMLVRVPSALSSHSHMLINQTFHHKPACVLGGGWNNVTLCVIVVRGPNQGHTATSQHQPFPCGSIGHQWGPAEDRGGGAATIMGNRLLLATPATSLEQAETQPCLCQKGQQPKAPCSGTEMGD